MDNTTGWFSIVYRKINGESGYKEKVRRVAGQKQGELETKKDFGSVQIEVRQAGTMRLETPTGEKFEIKPIGWLQINGKTIDHRF